MAESSVAAPDQSTAWIDTEYAPALRQLQSLQDQIDHLRNTIPAMIETFAPPPTSNVSPSQMYTEFAKVSVGAMQDLRTLRASWQDPQTKKALEQARASLEKQDDLDWEFISRSKWHTMETVESIEKAAEDANAHSQSEATQL